MQDTVIILDILFNLGTLISICIISAFIEYKKYSKFNKSIVSGFLFGVGSIIGMLNPVIFTQGIIFDGRSILISIAGLYYGPLTATIAAIMAAILRITQGGAGMPMGLLVISFSAIVGIILRKFWKIDKEVSSKRLLLMGYVNHIIMVLCMFALPPDKISSTLKNIAPIVMLFYPIATLAIGKVINYVFIQKKTSAALSEYEQRLLSIGNNFSHGMIYQVMVDKNNNRKFTYISKNAERMYGHTIKEMLADASLIYNRVHPDDREHVALAEEEARRKNCNFQTEARIIEPDGKIRWSLLMSTPTETSDGSVVWDGIESIITDKKNTEQDLLRSLQEKEVLIKEVYHRIKNTLQVIKGLLELQTTEYPESDEVAAVAEKISGKIQSISLVQEMLYESKDLSKISIKEYIERLTSLIVETSRKNINLKIESEDFAVIVDTLVLIGLIINEIMTNSIKHAFPNRETGDINIDIFRLEDVIYINYSDNGIGINKENINQNALGLKLLYSIVEQQLEGKIETDNTNGLKYKISFKSNIYKARI